MRNKMKTRLNAGKNRLSKCKQSVDQPHLGPCQISDEGKVSIRESTVTTRAKRGLATPKNKIKKIQKAITHTPGGRDDLLCSQHFDSQVVVGWDCQSPDTLREIKRFSGSEKTDEVSDLLSKLIEGESDIEELPKINTPPLLGVWRENKITKLQDNDTGIHNRLRKRGHVRKKKESDVSRDLLKNLTRALDKCSEDADLEEKDEKLDDNIDTRGDTCLSVLSESSAVIAKSSVSTVTSAITDKIDESSSNKLNNFGVVEVSRQEVDIPDETWSDDDLFDEDSFIVKATQIPVNNNVKFVSPVLGNKRKSSCDNIAPKCKTSRYSFQLGNDNDDTRTKPIHNNAFDLDSKKKLNQCALLNSANTSNDNETKPLSKKPPVFPPNPNSSWAFKKSETSSTPGQLSNHIVSVNSNIDRKSSTASSSLKNPPYRSNPVLNVQDFVHNVPKQSLSSTAKHHTSSTYHLKSSSVNNTRSSSISTANANNAKFLFKKHNSFSGPDMSCSNSLSRRRSVSGGSCSTMPNKANINNHLKPSVIGSSSVKNGNKTNTSNTTTIVNQSNSLCPQKSSTLSKSLNSSNNIINKQGNENRLTVSSSPGFSSSGVEGFYKKKLNDSGFDTSISDDLLCQLAEPDDVLDSVVVDRTVCGQPGSDLNVKSDIGNMKNEKVNLNCVKDSMSQLKVNSSSCSTTKICDTKTSTINDILVDKKEIKDTSLPGNEWGMNSEDLFASDDDYGDDGLTEPEVLAMLDEVELLATQQIAHERQLSSSQGNKKESPIKIQIQTETTCELKGSQESSSQNKYSQADIEKKKQEAIARRKMKMKR
ncbi:hypothetical protein ACF0H5_002141 [Mactra antiquata]